MPDITMCKGEGCSLKNKCYRYRAVPNKHRQSYFAKSPFQIITLFVSTETECPHFNLICSTDILQENQS